MKRSVLMTLAGMVFAAGCSMPTAEELVGYLDRLEFGAEWRLQSEEVVETPCELVTEACPRAVRVYRVSAREFPSSVTILRGADLETLELAEGCIEAPHEHCSALGWDDDVAINMTISSVDATDVEVLVTATERVGDPPAD